MGIASSTQVVRTLEKAGQELRSLLRHSETEIEGAGKDFEDLARHTDVLLSLAAGVVGCVEDLGASSILAKVQSLGTAAKLFIHSRLEATAGILETATAEAKLLERLAELIRGQRSIARETQTLSVLTHIEVARLGELGVGFQYLAHELDDFSHAVTHDTKELSQHTEERREGIAATRRLLAAGLPRIRQDFARIEADLEKALASVDSSQARLSAAPEQFRACTEQISGQIAGVVAAIQAHDITRQQLEHVRDALDSITALQQGVEQAELDEDAEVPRIAAGLVIQVAQLRNIRETMGNWVAQVAGCMEGILHISSSEVVAIGPVVLEQERELSSHLSQIELLEKECQTDSTEVEAAFNGLFNLLQLVTEHLKKSTHVRSRLQLLSFNSIIEANHLGAQADAILEISQSIKRISITWGELTDRSAKVMEEIVALVEHARLGMQAFSQAGNEGLREAETETRAGLGQLRSVAAVAAAKAAEIEAATAKLQAKAASAGASGARLQNSLGEIGSVQEEIDQVRRTLAAEHPGALQRCSSQEAEELYGAPYTTEVERAVLRASLGGPPLVAAKLGIAGNDVELF